MARTTHGERGYRVMSLNDTRGRKEDIKVSRAIWNVPNWALPFNCKCDDGEDRWVGDGLGGDHLGVADDLAEDPRVLPPQEVELEGHGWKRRRKNELCLHSITSQRHLQNCSNILEIYAEVMNFRSRLSKAKEYPVRPCESTFFC